jgi:urease accessory protein
MTWHASLSLDYSLEAGRTVARFEHNGPLRVLKSLYPEGDRICHNVLVHPPGGLAGGDTLDIAISAAINSHALVTTPAATRFYRSDGEVALQKVQIILAAHARMEWLPTESILHSGCRAQNQLVFNLAPDAELLGWDVSCLGLPHSNQGFDRGSFSQHLEMPGIWLERGLIDAQDKRLLTSPLGLAGHTCMGTLFFASGNPIDKKRRDNALHLAREILQDDELAATSGATSPNPHILLVRTLSAQAEPSTRVLKKIRAAWRSALWSLADHPPRIWAM